MVREGLSEELLLKVTQACTEGISKYPSPLSGLQNNSNNKHLQGTLQFTKQSFTHIVLVGETSQRGKNDPSLSTNRDIKA